MGVESGVKSGPRMVEHPRACADAFLGDASMTNPTCTIDGCNKPLRCRGWCNMHYRRWRATGSPGLAASTRTGLCRECAAPGCETPTRSSGALYCEMHYGRMRRSGTLDARERPIYTSQVCSVEGCEKNRRESGMCPMHAVRVRRHGSPDVYIPYSERRWRYGEDSSFWTGMDATYAGAHSRVRGHRGRAKDQLCADCGGPALHWSYDHQDPNELIDDRGIHYSADVAHYVPRCVPCHKKYDLGLRS